MWPDDVKTDVQSIHLPRYLYNGTPEVLDITPISQKAIPRISRSMYLYVYITRNTCLTTGMKHETTFVAAVSPLSVLELVFMGNRDMTAHWLAIVRCKGRQKP
jgi:hypothetical protein